MSNLRNPNIRTRDIRKLIGVKSQNIKWDKGSENNNEWVFTSLDTKSHKLKLKTWLMSKNIEFSTEVLIIDSTWLEPKYFTWGDIIDKFEDLFGKDMFEIFDLDLKWCLEYQPQEVSRFGRFQ